MVGFVSCVIFDVAVLITVVDFLVCLCFGQKILLYLDTVEPNVTVVGAGRSGVLLSSGSTNVRVPPPH